MSTEQQNASSSSYRCTYDAFLSFRGTDTRKGFTDHLYSALELAGIHTFRDDDEIERGANIEQELQTAIQESRVSVIVFSKDYASSRWCLNELAIIMERKRTDGHMVMPNDLCTVSSLKHLNLIGNPILCLPQKMKSLIMLETLLLDNCTNLEMLPELPPRLKRLEAKDCTSLKRLTNLPNLFRSLQSLFWGCEHLVEVESLLNIKPVRSADIEMTRYMGLFNLKSIASTDVEMINYLTSTTRKAPVQVLYECGIYSIFFHGSKIPDGFGFTRIYRSVLSVIVPSHPMLKIRGLNSCVLYAREPGLEYRLTVQHLIKVSNQTKGLMWTYSPLTVGLPTEKEDMLWLSHFRFGNNELEYGDELRVSVEMHDFVRVKEFGIQLVYEPERPPSSQNNVVAGDVSLSASEYQMWTGKYFLCNHGHRTHQAQFRKRQENPAHIEFSFGPERLFHKLFKARGPFETVVKLRAYPADSPSASPHPFWLK